MDSGLSVDDDLSFPNGQWRWIIVGVSGRCPHVKIYGVVCLVFYVDLDWRWYGCDLILEFGNGWGDRGDLK